ncbi:MAG: hypothetical protein KQJ78_16095 [Deltaproteobacteria bacterium]|nr:hypothetical protein [Deltaproteobacteria bacterium]
MQPSGKHWRRLGALAALVALCLALWPAAWSAAAGGGWKGAPPAPPAALSCALFPANNIWNTRVDNLPRDANSDAYVNTIGASTGMHPDFGSGEWPPGSGSPIGIPFVEVAGSQPKVAITFDYQDESDPGPYPIPPDAPIEGGAASDGDRHVLVLDRDNCFLYEVYDAHPQADGSWTGGSGAFYDLQSHDLRQAGWTSADAAGLPILPGLVRYDEVAAGAINHALRFTAPQTQRAYVWPARHYASSLTGAQYPPMGQRFRLRADFDISGYGPQAQVIMQALKTYGMLLADNGSAWYLSGAPDERWDNDDLRDLNNLKGSDFEAVDVTSLMVAEDSGQAGATCEYLVSPTQATFGAAGGSGSFALAATAGCPWTASSPDAWLSGFTPASGSGGATVAYTVAVNPAITPRQGVIQAAGWSLTVLQQGQPAQAGFTPMYRAYNPTLTYHFFTTSWNEFQNAVANGYNDESSGNPRLFHVATYALAGTSELFRLYNPYSGRHYYTRKVVEREGLVSLGWVYEHGEGYIYAAAAAGMQEIYHLYHTVAGIHLYTADHGEVVAVLTNIPGWEQHQSLGWALVPGVTP